MPFKTGAGNKPELYDKQTGRYTETSKAFKEARRVKDSLEGKELQGYTSEAMPGYEKAYTDPNKFYRYSLDPNHTRGGDKAVVYQAALGYNLTNAESLIKQIDVSIKSGNAKLVSTWYNGYGFIFKFITSVVGPNGNHRDVASEYIIDSNSDFPRMTTNYVK